MHTIKSIIITAVLSTSIVANSYTVIEGWKLVGTSKRDYGVICDAVIAVNTLKKQRADRFLSNEQYIIRINRLLATLAKKGIQVR